MDVHEVPPRCDQLNKDKCMASNKVGLLYLSGDTLLEAIFNNYAKLVLSTDTLLRINRGGIRQKIIGDILLDTE